MKELIFVTPPGLREDGALSMLFGKEAGLIAKELKDTYHCTFLCRRVRGKDYEGVPEGCGIIMDDSPASEVMDDAPSYVHREIMKWQGGAAVSEKKYDCAIVFGFYPWAIMTGAHRVQAERRFLYIARPLSHYVAEQDADFFREAIRGYNGVICTTETMAEDARKLLQGIAEVQAIDFPVDMERYISLAEEPCADAFDAECVNLAVKYTKENEKWIEQIPAIAAGMREKNPQLRWHILGAADRFAHLQRSIVVQDVWQEVIPYTDVENAFPYIRQCDGYVCLPGCEQKEDVRAARAMGKQILYARYEQDALVIEAGPLEICRNSGWTSWPDKEKLNVLIEGVEKE